MVTKAKPKAAVKVVKKVEEPVVGTPSTVPLGTFAQFVNGDDEFIGVVQSLDPLTVVEHLVRNGCQCEDVKEMDSLDGWTVTPLTKQDVFEALN